MRRAVIAGCGVASTASLALLVLGSLALADARANARATHIEPFAAEAPAAPATHATQTLCVKGAGGFAAAAAETLGLALTHGDGALDPQALAAITQLSSAASRAADRAARAPALPQRAGLDAVKPSGPCTVTIDL